MIEKLQNSSNISSSINYLENGNEKENKIEYLNKSDNKQERELYSYDGNKISAKEGIEYTQNFKYHEIRIYNQLTDNLTKDDLHKMAKDIINTRSKQSGGKITGIYAIHQRPDGTNKHLHIVFLSDNKKAFDRTGKGIEWQKSLTKIELKYTKDEKEKEKVLEHYNKALNTLKSRLTGTEKIDKFILTHMNKDNGNFGLKRALISIQKSKSIKNKKYYIKRLTGRLNSLEQQGIIQKINDNTYKVDIEKFNKMIENRSKKKIEKNLLKKEQQQLKIEIKNLQIEKSILVKQQKLNFYKLKSPFYDKQSIINKIQHTSTMINTLDKEVTKLKLEILDKKLQTYEKINPLKGAEYLLKNTILSTQKIREITELQLKRLEQLKRKGLVEKKGNEYIVKDKQKFKEYIKSEKADKDRTRIAKSKITNKTIKTKVNTFINKHSKVRPIRDFKSSYYNLSRIFGKTTGDRLLAFGIALGYSIAKNSIKLAFKIAISTVRAIIGTTSKTIKFSKNKPFERKIKKQKKNKPVTRKTQQNNKLTKNTDTLKKETKEQNKKTIEEILNREREEKNIEKSHTSSSKSR